jgi:hypothetical protein
LFTEPERPSGGPAIVDAPPFSCRSLPLDHLLLLPLCR